MVEKKSLFIRESSGLIKQVNLLDAVMLNLGNMSAGEALFQSISPYASSGAVLWLASILGFLLSIPQIIVYTIMTLKIRRTGGDYVWISRVVDGRLGSILALSYLIQSTAFFAIIAFFSASSVNSVLCTIGIMNHNQQLINLANNVFVNPYGNVTLYQRLTFYVISAFFFGIVIALNIRKAKWGFTLVTILGIFSIIALLLAMIVVGSNSSDFFTKLQPFLSAYNISAPTGKRMFFPGSFSLLATLSLLPLFALYTYPWINAGPSVSAEFKNSEKVAKLNIIIASVVTFLLVTLGFMEMDLVAGYNFNISAYPTFIYNFWTVAIALAGNQALQWIIGLGLILWNFYTLSYGVVMFSRYVFALSFDRILPEKFTEVNKYGSPVYAHLLDLTITLLLLLIPVFSINAAISLYGTTILGAVYLFFGVLAGTLYGFKNNEKILKIFGVLASGYLAYLTYEAATNPLIGFTTTQGINITTLLFVISAYVFAIGVFSASYLKHKREGVDLNMLFKEIPPE
ncbi:APC family permease [Sulfolobus sp. S-194]|uniref:APC family permease n=1 Tax=Sulfolobus sp. S-194 TaxID=2512240 RepID=UPI001436E9C9|nr:APC family permease [Sulfolobus sp. S-194]QIW24667.1 APC family permease [Sulfolobus sp. S-194]